jgi:hypothetical protein
MNPLCSVYFYYISIFHLNYLPREPFSIVIEVYTKKLILFHIIIRINFPILIFSVILIYNQQPKIITTNNSKNKFISFSTFSHLYLTIPLYHTHILIHSLSTRRLPTPHLPFHFRLEGKWIIYL